MDDKELRREYIDTYDKICASDDLRKKVLSQKLQKRTVTPLKATIGTVAAAIMIFAAVHDYSFRENTDGVISETTVTTQVPYAEFKSAQKDTTDETDTQVLQKPQKTKDTSSVVPKTTTDKPKDNTIAVAETNTQSPQISEAETAAPVDTEPQLSVAAYGLDGPSTRNGGATAVSPTTEMWEINRYYNYIGTDITSRIGGKYTGPETLEFEVGADGVPLDDTAVLTFLCNNSGHLRVTVSKSTLFDASLNGSVAAAGNGYNAYKIQNGVYYLVYATDLTQSDVTAIINSL